jgi:hypothetical protein
MFLGSATLAGILILVTIYGAMRKKKWAGRCFVALVAAIAIYTGVLFAFSAASKDRTLPRGQEKYFCEIDCHLAYSITNVQELGEGGARRLIAITIRTRFDDKTISARRPKDAPLTPNPRSVQLVDESGNTFLSGLSSGTSFEKSLTPGESYVSTLVFQVPRTSEGLRLLITAPNGPVEFLIGNELSLGHKKTYLGL